MMNGNITTVVFDLGGVIIDLVPERCVEAYHKLGFKDVERYLDRFVQAGMFLDLECGRITAAEFFDMLRPLCPLASTDKEIQDAFLAFLKGLPTERLAALRALRQRKNILALSNTNAVMFHSRLKELFEQEGLHFHDYFHSAVLSFEEGYCKPDPRIFHTLLTRFNLKGEATLFIDDSEKNCEAARNCGLQALHLAPGTEIVEIIESL